MSELKFNMSAGAEAAMQAPDREGHGGRRAPGQAYGLPSSLADASFAWLPALDIMEGVGALVLTLDLPGVLREQVDLHLEAAVLTVSGEREASLVRGADEAYRGERPFGAFSRAIYLAFEPIAGGVTASLHHGVLTIIVPRPVPQPAKMRINVDG